MDFPDVVKNLSMKELHVCILIKYPDSWHYKHFEKNFF